MDATAAISERDIVFSAADGLSLYAREIHPATETTRHPVICLPGLSRNGRDFDGIGRKIASDASLPRRVILLDSRGRGRSARDGDPTCYNVAQEMADLLTLMERLSLAEAIFIGTSRGGIILHALAAAAPDKIVAAVLNDIGPVIETEGLLGIRDGLSGHRVFKDFTEAELALRARYGAQFPALGDSDWADMARAIHAERDGAVMADFDPAIMAPFQALTSETALPSAWPHYDALAARPLLVLRGAHSDILSQETADEMIRRAEGRAKLVTVTGQGHVPLLHTAPAAAAIRAFLAQLD
ncbi:Pimeloyl-ACP methyl ester carboxylesterase [Rhizobium sp. RU20A]|uniref:alpha/beta fold hydrolase n=1 Tax=Rhizobium sp. RU20A TaxID=1907412 RepID=UPI0009556E38|nr:alpha/beta hydrolase [Rhizobium sp. RU20A]SIP91495.1 Pimeloyl-ACP methyl ester carboxylesterase [Rhizobium sp. RU20A]